MTLHASPVALARLHRVRFGVLALVALLLAHDAVYLAAHGPDTAAAMAASGHGYWPTWTALVLLAGSVTAGIALLTLVRLRARLAAARAELPRRSRPAPAAGPGWLAGLVSLWPRLALVVVLGFLLQENAEALLAGHAAPGIGALDGPLTLQALVAVSGLVAAAGAFLRWRERVLVASLAAARSAASRHHRPTAAAAPPAWGDIAAIVAHGWIVARRLAGRAPPVGIAHRPRGPRPVNLPA